MIVAYIGMTAIGVMILYNDFRRLSVKMWMLLLFVTFGIVAVIVSRAMSGSLNPIFLLSIPIYVVLNIINTRFNKNMLIGQADVDILNGTLSLLIPVAMIMNTAEYGDYTSSVRLVYVGGLVLDLLSWLLIGFIISITAALIKFIIRKIQSRHDKGNSEENTSSSVDDKLASAAAAATIKSGEMISDVKDLAASMTDNKKHEERQKRYKLRGTKIPVCLSFMPMFYFMVYAAITYAL